MGQNGRLNMLFLAQADNQPAETGAGRNRSSIRAEQPFELFQRLAEERESAENTGRAGFMYLATDL